MLSKLCKLSLIAMPNSPFLQTLLHIFPVDKVFLFLRIQLWIYSCWPSYIWSEGLEGSLDSSLVCCSVGQCTKKAWIMGKYGTYSILAPTFFFFFLVIVVFQFSPGNVQPFSIETYLILQHAYEVKSSSSHYQQDLKWNLNVQSIVPKLKSKSVYWEVWPVLLPY